MRSSMVTHGDASKQIWVTEFGAPTGGPGSGPVNENVQSQMLSNVIEQIAALPWSGPFLWYSFKDAGTTSDTVENFFGLLRADGSPKPAFYTFRSLTVHY
jgi:exo-beta-1,3-glucanase (GH17 family)